MLISVRVPWLRGVVAGDGKRVQAVLTLFGTTRETSLQAVTTAPGTPDDASCSTIVSWDDTLWLENASEAEDDSRYLELAFWLYAEDEAHPTALGFSREDISDFHTSAHRDWEVSMDLEGHTTPAMARVELARVEREPVAAGSFRDSEASDISAVHLLVNPQAPPLGSAGEAAKKRHNMTLEWGIDLEQFLIKAYDLRFGVRSIQHEVGRQVVGKLAAAHEEDVIGEGDTVILSIADNEVVLKKGPRKADKK
eukprot:GGOE01054154.1.p2 GENE.GGOE01054154.1~~GGOE01054154.1.p2  ORF type:complete len:252 (+),score=60.43 GGOE01054154.1:90-845(+)